VEFCHTTPPQEAGNFAAEIRAEETGIPDSFGAATFPELTGFHLPGAVVVARRRQEEGVVRKRQEGVARKRQEGVARKRQEGEAHRREGRQGRMQEAGAEVAEPGDSMKISTVGCQEDGIELPKTREGVAGDASHAYFLAVAKGLGQTAAHHDPETNPTKAQSGSE